MLRALGMRHRTLSSLLLTQAAFFAGPGIVIGFAAASLLNVGVVLGMGALADVTVPWVLHPAAWALGAVLGTAIPAVANIVPIQRALSRTLRDALDLYRQTTGEVTVKVMRLEKLGLSPLQTTSSVALVVVGFTTYYILPLSFVFRNLSLFLSVLNAILLCMLAGLAIMAVTVQPALERALLWSALWGRERKLGGIVSKNLAGHRPRNRKTATMITLTVAFLIFAGSLLALQARSISETVESFIGSDIAVRAPSWSIQLPEPALEAYLERYREGSTQVPTEFAVVRDYSWVSFPLSRTPGFTSTRLTNLARFPRPRSTLYGVERNYVEAAYDKFVIVTENAPRYSGADLRASGGDEGVVRRLHDNAGSLTLPIERGGISVPPQVATGLRIDDSGTVEYGSGEEPEEEAEEVAAGAAAEEAGIGSIETLEGRYRNYLDCIVSESVRLYSSVDTSVPLLSDARTEEVGGNRARQYLLAKAHAMARKMPGFGFSAYTPFAFGAPMLVPMAQVTEVVNRVFNALGLDEEGNPREDGATPPPTNDTASANGTASGNGTASLPVAFTPETLPKGTLLVRFRSGVSEDGRLRFVNGLRGVLQNDLITVDDAAELSESSQSAAFALNLFFLVVAAVALVLCFFASWLSFAANIRDNAREFGILRAVGLSVNQVLRCYLYEAGAVVGAAFILGTIVGAWCRVRRAGAGGQALDLLPPHPILRRHFGGRVPDPAVQPLCGDALLFLLPDRHVQHQCGRLRRRGDAEFLPPRQAAHAGADCAGGEGDRAVGDPQNRRSGPAYRTAPMDLIQSAYRGESDEGSPLGPAAAGTPGSGSAAERAEAENERARSPLPQPASLLPARTRGQKRRRPHAVPGTSHRVRVFPHQEGRWPTSVFVPGECCRQAAFRGLGPDDAGSRYHSACARRSGPSGGGGGQGGGVHRWPVPARGVRRGGAGGGGRRSGSGWAGRGEAMGGALGPPRAAGARQLAATQCRRGASAPPPPQPLAPVRPGGGRHLRIRGRGRRRAAWLLAVRACEREAATPRSARGAGSRDGSLRRAQVLRQRGSAPHLYQRQQDPAVCGAGDRRGR